MVWSTAASVEFVWMIIFLPPTGMPMICKLVTDTRASGLAVADPTLARYSDLHDYDHAQNWLY